MYVCKENVCMYVQTPRKETSTLSIIPELCLCRLFVVGVHGKRPNKRDLYTCKETYKRDL